MKPGELPQPGHIGDDSGRASPPPPRPASTPVDPAIAGGRPPTGRRPTGAWPDATLTGPSVAGIQQGGQRPPGIPHIQSSPGHARQVPSRKAARCARREAGREPNGRAARRGRAGGTGRAQHSDRTQLTGQGRRDLVRAVLGGAGRGWPGASDRPHARDGAGGSFQSYSAQLPTSSNRRAPAASVSRTRPEGRGGPVDVLGRRRVVARRCHPGAVQQRLRPHRGDQGAARARIQQVAAVPVGRAVQRLAHGVHLPPGLLQRARRPGGRRSPDAPVRSTRPAMCSPPHPVQVRGTPRAWRTRQAARHDAHTGNDRRRGETKMDSSTA